MPDLKEKAIRSVFWVGSARSFGQIFTWTVTIFLVRILSPSDFGLFAMGMIYTSIIRIIYDLNLGSAILQKSDITDEELWTSFWFIMILSFVFFFFTWHFSSLVAMFFGNDTLETLIKVMGAGLVIQASYLVPYWLLAKRLDFQKRAKAEISSSFLSQLTALIMAISGFGVWSLVMRFIAHELFLAVLIFSLFPWKPRLYFRPKLLHPLLKFGLSVTGFAIFKYSYENSDRIILGKFLGNTLLGYYSVALQLSRMPIIKVIQIINQVCFPVFSELQDDIFSLRRYFLHVTRLISLFAFPVLIGGIILAEELVRIFLGVKWVPIIFVLQILCAVAIPQTLAGTITALNNARGKPRINLSFSGTLAVTLTVAFLLTINYGLRGIALAWLIVYPIVFLRLLKKTTNDISLDLVSFLRNLLDPFLACLLMAVALVSAKRYFLSSSPDLASLSFLLIIGAGFYTGWFCLFSRQTFGEIASICHTLGFGKLTSFFKRKSVDALGKS